MNDLNTGQKLQHIEADLKHLCTKLGVTDALYIHDGTPEGPRQKLLKLAIAALQKLDDGSAAMSMDARNLSDEDRAVNVLAHAMGSYVPREQR